MAGLVKTERNATSLVAVDENTLPTPLQRYKRPWWNSFLHALRIGRQTVEISPEAEEREWQEIMENNPVTTRFFRWYDKHQVLALSLLLVPLVLLAFMTIAIQF